MPGGHFIKDQTEGVNIGAGVGRLPVELLGRHVGGSAHTLPLGGDVRVLGRPGESEVQEFHAGPGEHDVGGLQITMDDSAGMGGGQGACDLRSEFHGLLER